MLLGTKTEKPRRPRHKFDYYVTPEGHIAAGLDLVPGVPATILDTGAGCGAWGRAARVRWPNAHIIGVEARDVPKPEGYDEWHTEPFAQVAPVLPLVDLVCGNPPYREAEEFVRLGLGCLRFGGCVVFLLRLAFLESRRRSGGLYQEHPPELVSVCARRPRFYGKGGGAEAYAFFRWRKEYDGQPGLGWSLIGSTDDAGPCLELGR